MSGQRIFRPLIKTGKHKGLPKCIIKGCNNPGQFLGTYRKDGSAQYRAKCHQHHNQQICEKNNVKSIIHLTARKNGMNVTDYRRSKHPYRKHKKEYCQNRDGRLGFYCTITIKHPCMLDVDHIDNNHDNNNTRNLQTLCSSCHNYKTHFYGKLKTGSYIKKVFNKNRILAEEDKLAVERKQRSYFRKMMDDLKSA